MSGVKFLLDTNFILGMLKSTPDVLAEFAISTPIEDKAIELRRSRRVKLPDALIAATALCHGLHLLTMDVGLQSVLLSATERS